MNSPNQSCLLNNTCFLSRVEPQSHGMESEPARTRTGEGGVGNLCPETTGISSNLTKNNNARAILPREQLLSDYIKNACKNVAIYS